MFKFLFGILAVLVIFAAFPGISFLGALAITFAGYFAWTFGETVASLTIVVFLGYLAYLILFHR